jgi:hypothetical protein
MGSNRAGIRWYELRDADDGNWYIYQQSTWSPDATNSRWMGNIAMDQQGNIAMAYSFVGPSDNPGIRYTGRYATDPLDEMTVQEQIAVEGTGPQTGGNRWGDYGQMTMDPTDDMTFWFTGEWHGTSRRTEIFSFSSWHLAGDGELEKPMIPSINAYQPNPNQVTVMWDNLKDESGSMTLYDMNGKAIMVEQITGSSNKVSFDIPGNASGIYVIRLTGKNTDLTEKIYLAK